MKIFGNMYIYKLEIVSFFVLRRYILCQHEKQKEKSNIDNYINIYI